MRSDVVTGASVEQIDLIAVLLLAVSSVVALLLIVACCVGQEIKFVVRFVVVVVVGSSHTEYFRVMRDSVLSVVQCVSVCVDDECRKERKVLRVLLLVNEEGTHVMCV